MVLLTAAAITDEDDINSESNIIALLNIIILF
jgi:hypothetical protein